MRVGDVLDDGQAKPRPGQPAGRWGAIEAVEDVGQVVLRDAGTVVAYDHLPCGDGHLHGRAHEPPEELRLDQLVQEAVERARRHAPATDFAVTTEPCVVSGSRARLARAVGNLLDNAVKWSPPGGPVEVSVSGGEVTVRDHGPGIADDDLPHVFDRFYRAPAARGLPGSGLGLAIVKHVADAHGGRVAAESAEGGGARLRLSLPLSPSS